MTETTMRKVRSANIHVEGACNYDCAHCFSRCLAKQRKTPNEWIGHLEHLKSIGITKINLAGGEPMMYPYIFEMCELIKSMGFTVSIVSNGSLIDEDSIKRLSKTVSWIGLSIDSPDEEDEISIGRHSKNKNHLEHIIQVADWAHENGMKVKLNITVIRQSWYKDFRAIIERIRPERIKAFRALTLKDSNDDRPDTWSVSKEKYADFKRRHDGITGIVFEDNSDMIGSYVMFDPLGRWMVNNDGIERFLPFEQFCREGLESMVDVDRYYGRNGFYKWGE